MLEYFKPIEHQLRAIKILRNTPQCALFALPGTGKTAIALSVLKITDARALIIAPLATAVSSWPGEIRKWVQFSGMDFAIAHGKNREKAFEHRLTIMNPEGLKWLFLQLELLKDKDTLIVDESTFFKDWSSKRTKMIRKIVPMFERRHIMTGTPVSKTLLAWFSQQYIVDLGKSFGEKKTHFQKKYFYPGGFKNYDWIPFDTTSEKMSELAKGRFFVAENTEYKTPGLHFIDVKVTLPDDAKEKYKSMVNEFTIGTNWGDLTAIDARQKYGKLRQIASGCVYAEDEGETRQVEKIHTAKIDRVVQIVEEYGGPVAIGYMYDFELSMLRTAFKGKKYAEINGGASEKAKAKAQKDWEAGKLDLLFVHPKSGGHGLNLHHGGRCLIHLSLPDDPELYEQFNARIDRMGAEGVGLIYRILVAGTVETAVLLPRLLRRGEAQKLLIEHCKNVQEADKDGNDTIE